MVSNSAKLDRRTKQHAQSRVSTSDGSRDMARTRSWRKKKKKEKKMNSSNPIKHPLRGSLIMALRNRHSSKVKLLHPHYCYYSLFGCRNQNDLPVLKELQKKKKKKKARGYYLRK